MGRLMGWDGMVGSLLWSLLVGMDEWWAWKWIGDELIPPNIVRYTVCILRTRWLYAVSKHSGWHRSMAQIAQISSIASQWKLATNQDI